MGARVGTCRWCSAEVLWLRSVATGRPAPIDAFPDPDGNIAVDVAAGTYDVVGRTPRPVPTLTDPEPAEPPVVLHLNHWVTCRNATRRKAAKRGAKLTVPDDPPPSPGRTALRKDP